MQASPTLRELIGESILIVFGERGLNVIPIVVSLTLIE
jgi:hypothetical protein